MEEPCKYLLLAGQLEHLYSPFCVTKLGADTAHTTNAGRNIPAKLVAMFRKKMTDMKALL